MAADAFYVTCSSCGRPVAIKTVSVYESIGQFRGYSYQLICECGNREWHDGTDGGSIPEPMKLAAAHRRRADNVLQAIDFQRRELKASAVKTTLRAARVDPPELLDDGTWLVYRLANGQSVAYVPDHECYVLRDAATLFSLSSVADLAARLSG